MKGGLTGMEDKMETRDGIESELCGVEMEMRELRDRVRDASRAIDIGEAQSRARELERRKASLQRRLAELARPERGAARGSGVVTAEALLKAAREQRAITIGGAGLISQVRELFREIAETDSILSQASYYYGPNASTNIPVLQPMMEPEGQAEGSDAVPLDTQAAVAVTEIQPMAYAAVLPLTAEMIQMGAVDIESQVADIFGQSFRALMHRGMLTGSGQDKAMKGIFTSAADNAAGQSAAAGSAVTIGELAALALQVSSKDAEFGLLMNPSVYQAILSDSADSEDIKIYKEGLIRDKSIEGVKVLLDAYAPKDASPGSPLVAAVPLSRYAIGVAGELAVTPIRKLQDTKTYYQAVMFFSGRQVSDSDIYSIVAA